MRRLPPRLPQGLPLGLCSLALGLAFSACRPSTPAEAPAAEAAPESAAPAAAEAAPAGKPVACSGELVPAEDGLIDDFEDGNGQLAAGGGRDGYWWIAKDDKGSQVTVPGANFEPADGGAGSSKAAHVAGTTASGDGAWGAEFGVNFINGQGALYDASKYSAIRFKAKAAGPTAKLRVSLGDVMTHQDAGKCKACWNHFRKEVTLTNDWAEYTVSFAELQQRPGWGDPRPPAVDPTQVLSVSFAVEGGQPFDIWLDDLQFMACKG